MLKLTADTNMEALLQSRSQTLFDQQRLAAYKRTDRLFLWLFLAQWLVGIIAASITSPRSWAGAESEIHIHVWTSLFLGAAIIAQPIYLIYKRPGETITRHSVAIAQMLYSALLIHLTGGRIETHFHIFGSLAFLSFYRDWRVLISASLVVVVDHIVRGLYFPMSIYGVTTVEPWRWVEHAWWVVFEDIFLINCCKANVSEMEATAKRQAEVEITRDNVEALVRERTRELEASKKQLAGQLVENTQLANVVQWAGDAIIGHNLDGTITSWNNGAKNLFGYTAEEMRGKNIALLMPENSEEKSAESHNFGGAGHNQQPVETTRCKKGGALCEVSLTRSPIYNSEREIIGICEVFHNISERKEAERRVSEFYSTVSHELRTPLTSVRGALSLLENEIVEPGSEEGGELIRVARDSTDRLIRLINDILDLKKIEAGKLDLALKPLSAGGLVGECIKSLTGMTEMAQVKIDARLHFSGLLLADHDKATQILTNLISNAVKFSAPDTTVTVKTEASENGMVRISVEDHGPGISEGDQAKLFGKFQQLDGSDSRPKGGTGLGLAISKALVESHGGRIGLDSRLGEGSTFWFELPMLQGVATTALVSDVPGAAPAAAAASSALSASSGRRRILLVEDDVNLAQVLRLHFDRTDFTTMWAATFKDAECLLAQHPFDAVVLDLALPDGNGLDLLEKIKADPSKTDLPVIVITGQNIERNSVAEGAAADWLPKPFNTSKLVQIIDKLTATESVRAVMVADCDTGMRKVVGGELKARGLQCVEDLEQLRELRQLSESGGAQLPVVIYLTRALDKKDGSARARPDKKVGNLDNTHRPDLLDAVAELMYVIWK
ncbi:MAG: PAS domain S-box protein [Cyanobacteria bacterium REEB67]|nr:PAS domain S-box protein [Cyanobacteria bacterium REEB67]